MNELQEKNYTRNEVARILNSHPMTVYREIKRGKLEAFKVAHDFRISESALQDYIKKNRVKSDK